jgi:hypothetical protein
MTFTINPTVALSALLGIVGAFVVIVGSRERDLAYRLPRYALGLALLTEAMLTLTVLLRPQWTGAAESLKVGVSNFLFAAIIWTGVSELRFYRELRHDFEQAMAIAAEVVERGDETWTGKVLPG